MEIEGLDIYIHQNESVEDVGVDVWNLESIAWERTHYSPFNDLYSLHSQLQNGNFSGTTSSSLVFIDEQAHSTHDYVKFYIEVVAIVIVGVGGILGNILSVCVLMSAKMRSPITYLLLGLALTDLLMILNGLLAIAFPSFCIFFKIDIFRYKFVAFFPVIFAVGPTAHLASVLYALCITLERYFAVKDPLKARTLCTLHRAKITSVVVLLFTILYNIPRWFEYTYIKVAINTQRDDEDGEETDEENYYYLPVTTNLRKNQLYMKFMYSTHFICFYVIPMILIICFNVLIYLNVKFARKKREAMTVSQITENNVTTMLFLIVVVFIMCNCLPFVNLICRILTGSPEIFILDSIRNFLWIFNSSINFVIYYAYSDRFRETCVEMWPICFCFQGSKLKRPLTYGSTIKFTNTNVSSRSSVITVTSSLGSMKKGLDTNE